MNGSRLALPESFTLQRVSLKAVLITAFVSEFLLVGAIVQDFPLWGIVLAALIPWIPLFTFEAVWKYENYGFYAFLLAFTLLQIGHLGEHAAQVGQLLAFQGDASRSHGVFGALDRELVHFVWDSLVWVGVGFILYKLGPHNKWLWISFIAATFHEYEHAFLYYLDLYEPEFYGAGGDTGLLARGGMIGTPFARPYLHFIYNFFVVVPLIVALWDETKYAYNVWLAKALPSLTRQEKVSTTAQLDAMKFERGQVIVRQGDLADNFYIVSDGSVEVIHETDGTEDQVAVLGPGQFFGEIGLLSKQPRSATVRALEDTEVLALDQGEFTMMVTRSRGASADLEAELHDRLAELKKNPA